MYTMTDMLEAIEAAFKRLTHRVNKETREALKSVGLHPTRRLEYLVMNEIAGGSFGDVYSVNAKGKGRVEARKVNQESLLAAKVSKADTSESVIARMKKRAKVKASDIETILHELRMFKVVQSSKFIVKLEDYFYLVKAGEETLWLVMEYIPLCLAFLERTLTQKEIGAVVSGIIKALEHVHSRGVIHMDVKVENILVSEAGQVKLCDFGTSEEFVKGEVKHVKSQVGTPYTMALELWEKGAPYDESVDVWSLGVVAFVLTREDRTNTRFGELDTSISRTNLWGRYRKSNSYFYEGVFRGISSNWAENHDIWEADKAHRLQFAKSQKAVENIERHFDRIHAESIEYSDVIKFCKKAVIPLSTWARERWSLTREDVIDRFSLDKLKELSLVRNIIDDEPLQRSIMKSVVHESH